MKLILVRHGQSTYNLENRFTGWKNVDLTDLGRDEALRAGQILKNNSFKLDYAYTSNLKRAQNTLDIIFKTMDIKVKTINSELLNERDYGDLVGQNKLEAAEKFGPDQVQIWRRSYDVPPPGGESLKMTCDRTLPYFNKILKKVIKGNNIIIGAHGNSIRAIVMNLFKFSPNEILKTEIGWCEPWVFTFDKEGEIIDFKIFNIYDNKSSSKIPEGSKIQL